MQTYADPDLTNWMATMATLRPRVAKATALESAAGEVARELAERYSVSTALARVYVVMPYVDLEPDVRAFVDRLAARSGEAILPETPVLVLLGTHGAKPEWCDRNASEGHRAIPLASPSFVQAIPMVASLLKELGVNLSFLDSVPALNTRRLLGGSNGLFFVSDAANAKDPEGRLIIPAQDFVAQQRVRTVFGMGGAYKDGTLVVLIVFARELLLRSQVERLTSLISLFKNETSEIVTARKFFAR